MKQTGRQLSDAHVVVTGFVRLYSVVLLLLLLMRISDLIWFEVQHDWDANGFQVSDILLDIGGSGIVSILFGTIGLVCSKRIAQFLVGPPRPSSCPKCRFSLENFRADRCPECGLYLGPDFHAPPAPTETTHETESPG